MIVVDSSAIIAILENEPEQQRFKSIIRVASRRIVSSVTAYETGIVALRRRGPAGLRILFEFLADFDFEIVPFDSHYADIALAAYARFGKGIDPAARLNLGDCASYAVAKALEAPLLFKGNDFARTDIRPCL